MLNGPLVLLSVSAVLVTRYSTIRSLALYSSPVAPYEDIVHMTYYFETFLQKQTQMPLDAFGCLLNRTHNVKW